MTELQLQKRDVFLVHEVAGRETPTLITLFLPTEEAKENYIHLLVKSVA
jgi:hypothetical protein